MDISKTRADTSQFVKSDAKDRELFVFANHLDLVDFQKIFLESRYLLSEDIIKSYLKLRSEDTYFGLDQPLKEDKLGFYSVPCSELKKLTELEYEKIKNEYEQQIGLKK